MSESEARDPLAADRDRLALELDRARAALAECAARGESAQAGAMRLIRALEDENRRLKALAGLDGVGGAEGFLRGHRRWVRRAVIAAGWLLAAAAGAASLWLLRLLLRTASGL